MNMRRIIAALALLLFATPALAQVTNPWPRFIPVRPDGSVIDPGSVGGGGGGGTVTQGPAAADTSTNRWPVLAYQGGTWTFGLSGPIPAGTNVIGAVTQSGGPWAISGSVNAVQSGTWNVGLSAGAAVLADLRVAGAAVAAGNPVPVSVGNFPSSQAVTNAGTFAVQNTAATPTGGNVIGSTTLRSTGTNRSANVTTTAANLMAANTSRQGWKIKNDCTVAVWINFDGTASAAAGSGNFQIAAGAYMASEPGFVETGAMSAIAASGTCALTVREH